MEEIEFTFTINGSVHLSHLPANRLELLEALGDAFRAQLDSLSTLEIGELMTDIQWVTPAAQLQNPGDVQS